jgi:glycosyltransferase involved in cell wall biosynthesis
MHDTSVWDYPASYSRPFRLLYRTLLPALGRRAAAITTVSHYSAGRLAARGIAPAGKITVMPDGHEHALAWRPAPGFSAPVPAEDLAVVIGSLAAHKNLDLVLRLAALIEGTGIRIAVVGAVDTAVFSRTTLAAPDRVLWLGRLSDDELAALLERAFCLLFPSFAEGFGLPLLEAMARGCPVVSSDRASMPEIGGEAVLYAPPTAPEAWRAALLRLRADPRLREKLIAAGRARAARYSWQGSAAGYLALMARLDAVWNPRLTAAARMAGAPAAE